MPKDDAIFANVIRANFANRKVKEAEALLNDEKVELFRKWLNEGIVGILFDARNREVEVPAQFKMCFDLRLNFCYQYHVPDFNFNKNAVYGTLSFNADMFFCKVPWSFVYGMYSERLGMQKIWYESCPKDENSAQPSDASIVEFDLLKKPN